MSTRELDAEKFLFDLKDLIKDNFAAKIAEINSCKNDGITLTDIGDERYLLSLSEEALNYEKFIYFGIQNINARPIGPATAQEITIFFEMVFVDPQLNTTNDSNMIRESLRYSKAMKEIIEENYRRIRYVSSLEVKELAPINLQSLEEDNSDTVKLKVGGVKVVGNLT